MIVAGRSFDPKAQKEELETPTLPLVSKSNIFFLHFEGNYDWIKIMFYTPPPDLAHAPKPGSACGDGDRLLLWVGKCLHHLHDPHLYEGCFLIGRLVEKNKDGYF